MGPKNSNRLGSRKVTKKEENNWTEEDFQNAIHELDSLPGKSGEFEPTESTTINVSLQQWLLEKVKPIQEKQKKN